MLCGICWWYTRSCLFVYVSFDTGDRWMHMGHWRNNTVRENRSILRKTCLSITLSITNPTVLELNLGFRGERPAINSLIHDSYSRLNASCSSLWFAKASIFAFISKSDLTRTSEHLPLRCRRHTSLSASAGSHGCSCSLHANRWKRPLKAML